MINIETIEDVKLLKELTGDDSRIIELESKIKDLNVFVKKQNKIIREQNEIIKEISSREVLTAQDVLEMVSKELDKKTPVTLPTPQKVRLKKDAIGPDDYFTIPQSLIEKGLAKEYNKVLVDGNKLIHFTVRNQKMTIPVTTIQLLYMLEKQKTRGGKLLNKDVDRFATLFKVSRQKLIKVCYNLQERVFFDVINSVDDQIKQSNFKIKDGFIYIINKGKEFNTQITPELFNDLVQIYINSNKEFETIFNLSMEYKKINPIYLLTVLKRNNIVSKAIAAGD